jgi:hypothetical protein
MAPCVASNQVAEVPVIGSVPKRDIFGAKVDQYIFKKVDKGAEYFESLRAREKWPSNLWEETLVENLRQNALNEEKFVILALANIGMKEMTMNWIASLLRNKYTKFVVICFDFEMYMFLCEYGFERNAAVVPRDWIHKDISAEFVGWLSQGYKDLLHGKVLILIELWKRGFGIFYNDVDLVFLSDKVFEQIMLETALRKPDFAYMFDGVDINGAVYLSKSMAAVMPRRGRLTAIRTDTFCRRWILGRKANAAGY